MTEVADALPYEVVCPDTRTLQRPAWLSLRRQGLGSSDAAPAMGMSPWVSQYTVFAEKRGLLAELPDNERFLWGRLHEENILNESHRRGWTAGNPIRALMVRSKEHPWMLANPDGLTEREVVESKTADAWDEKRWEAGVPDHYTIQAMHSMIVTGRRRAILPVLFGGNNLRCFDVDWDERLVASIVEGGRRMWQRILDNDPPDPDGSESTMDTLREIYMEVVEGKSIDLPPEFDELLNARLAASAVAKGAKKTIDGVKARIMALLGDAQTAKYEGETVATWTGAEGKRRFNWKDPK